MIIKNLFRRKTRTLLTLIGIIIGIVAIVALRALADGLAANYTTALSRSNADLVVGRAKIEGGVLGFVNEGIDEKLGERIAAMPEVEDVAGMVYTIVPMPGIPYFVLFGYDPDDYAIQHFKISEGRMLGSGRGRRPDKEIIIGKAAAENLEKGVGDTVRIYESTYRIVGIYETGAPMEDGAAVASLAEAQRLSGKPHQVIAFLLKLKNVRKLEAVRERIERRFPDLAVSQTSEATERLDVIEIAQAFAWGISFFAAMVGGVGMMNTMLMSVFERTREIGTLRALGWRRWRVLTMIMGESLGLSLLGSALGMAFGVMLVKLLSRIPAIGSLSQGSITSGLFLQALSMALALGVLGGIYPAWWASRLAPVQALSREGDGGATVSFLLPGGLAVRNLFRRRIRTLLTIVGLGMGIMGVVAISGLTEGFIQEFSVVVAEAELTAVEAGISDMAFSTIDERVGKRIAAMPEVEYVSGSIMGVVSFSKMPLFIVNGYRRADPTLRRFHLVQGEGLTARREILLGHKAAEILGREVGDTIRLLGATFSITGIYETGSAYEDNGGVIDLREAQSLLHKPRQVMLYSIKVRKTDQVEQVLQRLKKEYPELLITRSADFAESLPDMQNSRAITDGILLLIVLVGSVILMNTMVMSVFERTREIGVLRAVGWRKGRILRMILAESIVLTLISGLVGVALAWALTKLLGLSPAASIATVVRFTPGLLARTAILALTLGAIGGLYPAWRAAKLAPVEALRYE